MAANVRLSYVRRRAAAVSIGLEHSRREQRDEREDEVRGVLEKPLAEQVVAESAARNVGHKT
jgi:hypothetical protein